MSCASDVRGAWLIQDVLAIRGGRKLHQLVLHINQTRPRRKNVVAVSTQWLGLTVQVSFEKWGEVT